MRSNNSLSDDHLFRPTLTEQHDAVGFSKPWNPTILVFLAFFGGVLCGPLLGALNFGRLGMRRAARRAMICVATLAALIWIAPMALISLEILQNDAEGRQAVRLGHTALSTALALFFAKLQRPRMHVAINTEVTLGKLLVPAVVTWILSMAIFFMSGFFTVSLFSEENEERKRAREAAQQSLREAEDRVNHWQAELERLRSEREQNPRQEDK